MFCTLTLGMSIQLGELICLLQRYHVNFLILYTTYIKLSGCAFDAKNPTDLKSMLPPISPFAKKFLMPSSKYVYTRIIHK